MAGVNYTGRRDPALEVLFEICRLLDARVELESLPDRILEVLANGLGIVRGTVTLLKRDTKEILIDAAFGLTSSERERGRYQLGEGVTGQVVESGMPLVLPRIGDAPEFLDRIGARDKDRDELAFICVPVKVEGEILGALSVDRPTREPRTLEDDVNLLSVVALMIAQIVLSRRAAFERAPEHYPGRPANVIGSSKAMKPVFQMIQTVSRSDATVLVRGESGVGKELVAEGIHESSRRAGHPLIKVNCAALPQTILESELFGHEKGAFTGAIERRRGRFELAHGGTIFLDEIGDFSPTTQVTLLRILQNKEFQRVGGSETIKTDVRIIAATNRDLEKLIEDGLFRQDLYYRLNVFPIHVPPLRERRADVLLLADAFVEKFSRANEKDVRRISSRAIDMLMAYHWPGNVRELENCIERAVLLADDHVIHAHNLPPSLQTAEATGTGSQGSLDATLDAIERDLIDDALKTARGNMAKAARSLGLTERKMGLRVQKHNIDARRYRVHGS
ncbi:MAG: sigma 54-interacting transcriptional regulator [Deltaproteobacteria bacterium]|nr:sigma 54-interacting transcriptional regulator [Deltaproteobacteria bacterium]